MSNSDVDPAAREDKISPEPDLTPNRYHPAEEDEWAADDEPAFSAVHPEPRWVS